jgi:pectate lyase-like protein
VVRGARLWNNVDDGFDAWLFTSPIRIENSLAYGNGYNRWNLPDFSGDGNGFKLGGGTPAPAAGHTVVNTISYGNAAGGFVDNGNPGAITFTRDTAWRNAKPVSLGGSTGSGNSWDLGGTWNDSSLVSTDASTTTGARDANGAIRPSTFLNPKNQPALGARL